MTIEEFNAEIESAKVDLAKRRLEMEMEDRRWRNRRRMAYMSLSSIFIITLAVFTVVPESKLPVLSDITTTFYFINSTIILAYFGLATTENLKLPPKR
jgi:hypothetical protein